MATGRSAPSWPSAGSRCSLRSRRASLSRTGSASTTSGSTQAPPRSPARAGRPWRSAFPRPGFAGPPSARWYAATVRSSSAAAPDRRRCQNRLTDHQELQLAARQALADPATAQHLRRTRPGINGSLVCSRTATALARVATSKARRPDCKRHRPPPWSTSTRSPVASPPRPPRTRHNADQRPNRPSTLRRQGQDDPVHQPHKQRSRDDPPSRTSLLQGSSQSTVRSSLGSVLRISQPLSVTSTRSSIRIPNSPAR